MFVTDHDRENDDGLRTLGSLSRRRPRTDALAAAWAALAHVSGEDPAGWSIGERAARVRDLALVVDRARAEMARAVADLDVDDGWAADGAVSPVAWLTHGSPVARSESSSLLRLGRFLRDHPATAAAVASGRLPSAAAEIVARFVTGAHAPLYDRDEAVLIEQVQRLARIDDAGLVMRRWAALADDELAEVDAAATHQARHLSVSRTLDDGGVVDGRLDTTGTSLVVQALELLDPGPDAGQVAGGVRTPGQRRADALVEMARRTVNAQSGGRRGASATVHVVVDADLLGLVRHDHCPPVLADDVDLASIRCDVDGVPAPVATVERLLCDSLVSRVVMRGRSAPLELGHAARFFTSAQRRAIILRDGGCMAHGCDRGPEFCEVHHLEHWDRGGRTDVANGALLCARHHHLVHEGGWVVVPDDEGRPLLRPPSTLLPRRHRRFRRPEVAPDAAALDQRIRRRLLDLRAEIRSPA